jgi:hypothetical protein
MGGESGSSVEARVGSDGEGGITTRRGSQENTAGKQQQVGVDLGHSSRVAAEHVRGVAQQDASMQVACGKH